MFHRLVSAFIITTIAGCLTATTVASATASIPVVAPVADLVPTGFANTLPILATGEWDYEEPQITIVVSQREKVMTTAMQYVGVRYRSGGNTPRGFDCSGFTQYVYALVGVQLPDTAAGQRYAGTRVSQAEARPGDLVVWRGHVGIYAGNGMRLDANRPGSSVALRPLYGNPVFVRVLP